MFGRLGDVVTRRAWWVIGLWLVALAVLLPLSPGLKTSSGGSSDLRKQYESVRADAAGEAAFPEQSGPSAIFVLTRHDGNQLRPNDMDQARRLAAAVNAAGIAGVSSSTPDSSALSPDRKVLPVTVVLPTEAGTNADAAARITEALRAVAAHTVDEQAVSADLTGGPPLTADADEATSKAEVTLTIGTIAALIVLLALIFRSPVAVVMPLVAVGLVYFAARALVGLFSAAFGFQVGSFAPSLLVVILFGVGVDYTLFLMFRYRELMRRPDQRSREAVARSIRSVGEAISSSALVVIAAFVALLFSDIKSDAALAPTLIISIAVMLLAGLTLTPAVMTVLGRRLFWLNRTWRQPPRDNGFAAKASGLLARRPVPSLVVGALLLGLLGVAAVGARINYDPNGGLPDSYASVRGLDDFTSSFPAGAISPTQIYLPAGTPAAAVGNLRAELTDRPGIAEVQVPQTGQGEVVEIDVILDTAPYTQAALDTVADEVRPLVHHIAGDGALVGGQTAVTLDIRTATLRDLRVIYLVAALLIALILGAVLRSLVAPVLVLVLVGLAFLGALGSSVLVVQHWQHDAGVSATIPLLLFLLVVALGSDYMIIMAARLREESRHHHNRRAVEIASRNTIPTIAAAGAVLAATFASLIITGVSALSQIGLAVVTGVLLVSFVVACWLLPAIARILGAALWWPRRPEVDARISPGVPVEQVLRIHDSTDAN